MTSFETTQSFFCSIWKHFSIVTNVLVLLCVRYVNLQWQYCCRPLVVGTALLSAFPSLNTSAHLDDVVCSGDEEVLTQCSFDFIATDCLSHEDAGAQCYVPGDHFLTSLMVTISVNCFYCLLFCRCLQSSG